MANEYQTELNRINQNIADTYSVLNDAGAATPTAANSENLASTAAGISAVLYNKSQILSDTQKAQARANIGALAESELDNAVTGALEQAKESGEFKGETGDTGPQGPAGATGAGVKSMTYNASTNKWTVTLTDNTTLSVDGPAIPDVSGYMPKSGGTFTGAVVAGTAAASGYYVRNIKFSETAETPTTEGDICFKLK